MKVSMAAAERLLGSLRRLLFCYKWNGIFRVYCAVLLTALAGREKCRVFLEKIPDIRTALYKDLQAAYDGDPAARSREEVLLCYPGFYAVMTYRLAHELYKLEVPLLPRMMTELAHSRTGIDIHPGAIIGSGFFIDHGTGVVVGQTAVIGRNVKLYQGVTLGGLSTRGGRRLVAHKRHPTIEDGVTVYANATVLGGETVIGAGSTIGANAFVTASVPPDTKLPAGSV